jgi:hypothetical protein
MYGVDDVERGTHITDGVRPSLPLRSPYCPTWYRTMVERTNAFCAFRVLSSLAQQTLEAQ